MLYTKLHKYYTTTILNNTHFLSPKWARSPRPPTWFGSVVRDSLSRSKQNNTRQSTTAADERGRGLAQTGCLLVCFIYLDFIYLWNKPCFDKTSTLLHFFLVLALPFDFNNLKAGKWCARVIFSPAFSPNWHFGHVCVIFNFFSPPKIQAPSTPVYSMICHCSVFNPVLKESLVLQIFVPALL